MAGEPVASHQAASGSSRSASESSFSQGIHAFLGQLPPSALTRMFDKPSSCLSIFRLLPETARHLLLNILWSDLSWSRADLAPWVRERSGASAKNLNAALEALRRLHIVELDTRSVKGKGKASDTLSMNGSSSSAIAGATDRVVVNERFRDNFRTALTGGGTHGSFGIPPASPDDIVVNVTALDDYAESTWESILHFMVGSKHDRKPSDRVMRLLEDGQLMVADGSSSRDAQYRITARGFHFLLEEVNRQLWGLLLLYLRVAPDTVEVLQFLFMLGSLELGRDYSTERLTATERNVLRDLRDLGLVYQHQDDTSRFYPTRLATTLTSSAAPLVSSRHADEEKGFLILETNYKIYAYTSNPLQVAVMNLFIHIRSRYPNLVTGQITRDSIKRALDNGIGANEIIAYLESRAHPQMRKQASLLPSTVVDQIRLWERERNRIKTAEGYLWDQFTSTEDFELVHSYARDIEVVVWANVDKRLLFVALDGQDQLKDFVMRRMAP